ncbi:MAG: HAD family hydrolase [Nanoarchaeota archaeon]|nr:HAD family hydrolase [Nanoarchaeota archaeon]
MDKIKAVIFDLYGTLIYQQDTKPYLRLFLELGLLPEEIRQARRIALTEDFQNLSGFVNRIKPDLSIDLQAYEEEVAQEVESAATFPETKKVLGELRGRGLPLGLISNLGSPYKRSFFNLGLDTYFQKVFFSCEVGISKPNLIIYERMLQELNINPSQALMIGDKVHCDIDPPKSIGMEAILIDRNKQYSSTRSIQSLEEIFQYL